LYKDISTVLCDMQIINITCKKLVNHYSYCNTESTINNLFFLTETTSMTLMYLMAINCPSQFYLKDIRTNIHM